MGKSSLSAALMNVYIYVLVVERCLARKTRNFDVVCFRYGVVVACAVQNHSHFRYGIAQFFSSSFPTSCTLPSSVVGSVHEKRSLVAEWLDKLIPQSAGFGRSMAQIREVSRRSMAECTLSIVTSSDS